MFRIFTLGDNALTIEFGDRISARLNDEVLRLDAHLTRQPFAGMLETVPAYSSLTVYYDCLQVRKNFANFPTAADAVRHTLENALAENFAAPATASRTVEIPVCFDEEFAPDLAALAEDANLTVRRVIEIFTGDVYRVFMLGFLPGFAYMGEVDAQIARARRANPRTKVAAGSVGIAGTQTGIYSLESPGGWQIIGRTPRRMFAADEAEPALLRAGDTVQFAEITRAEFDAANENR